MEAIHIGSEPTMNFWSKSFSGYICIAELIKTTAQHPNRKAVFSLARAHTMNTLLLSRHSSFEYFLIHKIIRFVLRWLYTFQEIKTRKHNETFYVQLFMWDFCEFFSLLSLKCSSEKRFRYIWRPYAANINISLGILFPKIVTYAFRYKNTTVIANAMCTQLFNCT